MYATILATLLTPSVLAQVDRWADARSEILTTDNGKVKIRINKVLLGQLTFKNEARDNRRLYYAMEVSATNITKDWTSILTSWDQGTIIDNNKRVYKATWRQTDFIGGSAMQGLKPNESVTFWIFFDVNDGQPGDHFWVEVPFVHRQPPVRFQFPLLWVQIIKPN